MSGWLLAVAVTALGLVASVLWFGVSRRRKAEIDLGIQSLATMKWRECIAVVLESLQREGYELDSDSIAGGGSGATEFLLTLGDQKVLLGYKHGTAYRLGDANVREFANSLHMRGARRGILITLGSVETSAWSVAESSDVKLLDGAALWTKLRPFVPAGVVDSVRENAAGTVRRGLGTGAVASLLAGALVMIAANFLATGTDPANAVAPATQTRPQPDPEAPGPRADDEMLRQLNATAKAMADVARLTPIELARRRADVAKQVSQINQVDTAAWSAPHTLLISLNRTDGKDKVLIDEICRILTQNEEMRFTRIQLDPPADSKLAVRWRLCE